MPVIYEPKGQAREYAPLACNVYSGCAHGCVYCYVPGIPPYKFQNNPREAFHSAPHCRNKFLKQVKADALKMARVGRLGQVLLSFTTDPYQPIDVDFQITRQTIEILHNYGLTAQILTKGGSCALRDIDILGPRDAFATTMTLLDNERSLEWEPNAASPADRIYAIEAMHSAGIPTWISLEPVIDPTDALEIIRQTHTFVDLFKVGKINYIDKLPTAFRSEVSGIDWQTFATEAVELLESVKAPYYIKDSLLPYLPDDFSRGSADDFQLAGKLQPSLFNIAR